jgi:hypothetical protein
MEIFCLLHPLAEVDLPFFVDDFHFETKVILDREAFVFTLVHSPHLFYNGPSDMVYELYETILSHMILGVALTFFSKYVGTLFEVMFHL